jgi:hypothetical protein
VSVTIDPFVLGDQELYVPAPRRMVSPPLAAVHVWANVLGVAWRVAAPDVAGRSAQAIVATSASSMRRIGLLPAIGVGHGETRGM